MTESEIQKLFEVAKKATALVAERDMLKEIANKLISYVNIRVTDNKSMDLASDGVLKKILVAGCKALIVEKESELAEITFEPKPLNWVVEEKVVEPENLNSNRVSQEECQACDGTGKVINDHGDQIDCLLCLGTGRY